MFSKIFEQTYEPITIPLTFDKFEAFSSLLEFLHGEDIYFNYNNVFKIIELARAFDADDILEQAIDWIFNEPQNGKLEKLEFSERYAIPELQKVITDNILDLDELFQIMKHPAKLSRRLLQILQDRMINLPIPADEEKEFE